jgi:hypothetical protein
MISLFKKHFIPHEANDHRPHFLRNKNMRNVLFLVLFLEIFTFLIPTITKINITGSMASVLPSVLSDLTNTERKSQKLSTLSINPILNKAAEMKAQDMAKNSYFAHTSPSGKNPWYWLKEVGYSYQYAGENLAINFTDSKDVTSAWMASPTHKANIVKENYTEIGTGVAFGVYQGRETVFVAQVYANPAPKTISKSTPSKTQSKNISLASVKKQSTNVLGVQIDTKVEDAKNETEVATNVSEKETQIPSEQSEITPNSTFVERFIASPRNSTNTMLYIILGIVAFSLLLNIFIKIKHHHIDLVANGLVAMVLIVGIFVGNYYITHRSMVVTQTMDYANTDY